MNPPTTPPLPTGRQALPHFEGEDEGEGACVINPQLNDLCGYQ